jgi:hypothetical protein
VDTSKTPSIVGDSKIAPISAISERSSSNASRSVNDSSIGS